MLAWAEELGAEATTVTELLEEDNEEVGLGLAVLDVVIVILHVCISVSYTHLTLPTKA